MKLINQSIFVLLFLISISNYEIIAQAIDEYEEYINVEIRDTHILYVHLLQSEINGDVEQSANISYLEEDEKIYVVAQSLIKTYKDFETIRSDVGGAMSRLREEKLIRLSRSNLWENVPNESQMRTSWTVSEVRTGNKMELIIYYSTDEREILVSTIPHQYVPAN